MRALLLAGVVFLCTACGDSPTAPSLVCTVEQHALSPVYELVGNRGFVLVDSGPLTPVNVCRRP